MGKAQPPCRLKPRELPVAVQRRGGLVLRPGLEASMPDTASNQAEPAHAPLLLTPRTSPGPRGP